MFRIIDKSIDKNSKEYKEFRKKANERNRKYYSKPKVKKRKKLYKKQYEVINRERIKEWRKEYDSRLEIKERARKWRETNKEYLKEYNKKYRQKHKKRKNRLDRKYRKRIMSDPILHQKLIEQKRRFRKEYPEVVKKSKRKYNQSPKGKLTSTRYVHKRLAKIHGNGFDLTKEQIKQVWDRDKVCVYCGSNKKLELDHIIPLKKGGKTTFLNFVLACVRCNRTKSGKDVFEWCKLQGKETPEIVLNNLKTMNYKL